MELLSKLETLQNFRTVSRTITLGDINIVTTDYQATGRIDDVTYQKDKELWEYLPRCFATIKHNNSVIRIICGLRKFGNENEFGSVIQNNEILCREFYLNKANGEYSSFSTFRINSILFYVFRSKNVSMVLRSTHINEDFTQYNEPRYMFAKEMATTFLNIFNKLPEDKKAMIIERTLVDTISMEYCAHQHQHIVDYNGVTTLYPFITTNYNSSKFGLTSELPDKTFEWFDSVGIPHVPYIYVVNLNNKDYNRDKIRNSIYTEDNSEGAVVYQTVINTVTNVERVYKVYKYKNFKYIFWRAVREKMRSRATSHQLVNRLKNLHCTIPEKILDDMIQEAIGFYAYCWDIISIDNWDNLFSSWITYFNQFTKLSIEDKQYYVDKFKTVDTTRQQFQIMTIGIPGSGKSTLLKILEKLVPNSKRVNQDECNKSAKIYHRTLAKLSKNNGIKLLLMDKCYHNKSVRNGTLNTIDIQNLVYFIYYHPDDINENEIDNIENFPLEHALVLADYRINSRGIAHLNLYPSPELDGILNGFKKSYEVLDSREHGLSYDTFYIDMTLDITSTVNKVLNYLQSKAIIEQYFDNNIINDTINKVLEEENMLRQKNNIRQKNKIR